MPETPCTIQSCELSEFFWSFLPGQRPGKLLCFSEKRMHVHGTWHIRRELIMDKRKRITFEYQFFFFNRQRNRAAESLCCWHQRKMNENSSGCISRKSPTELLRFSQNDRCRQTSNFEDCWNILSSGESAYINQLPQAHSSAQSFRGIGMKQVK